MTNLAAIVNNQVVVSSRQVAESFEKRHDNVLRDIESLKKDILNFEEMFQEAALPDSYGREQRVYLMNRDGFSLLVMGFTGSDALQWKLKYIQAFNEMERELANKNPQTYLEALKALVATEEAKLEAERAREIAETKVIQLTPKAEKYDEVINTAMTYSISDCSLFLGLGYGNNLHSFLVKEGWLDKPHRGSYTVGEMAPEGSFKVAHE